MENVNGIEPVFVRANASHLKTVLEFVEKYYEFDGLRFRQAEIQDSLKALLQNPALGGAWLVRIDGENVGYFIMTFGFDAEFGGRYGTLTDLFIVEQYRRSGMGTRILRFMETVSREFGLRTLELQVERKNLAARGFYEKLGFEERDRIPMTKEL